MKTILIICGIFLSAALSAQPLTQTIRGKVVDADSKSSLPGANVIILHSDPLIGTTTNDNGDFILTKVPVGRQSLQVSFIGYQTVIKPEIMVSSGKEVVLTIELPEDILQAKEVEIKATVEKDKPINRMATVSARSFNVEESRRYAGSADDPMRAVSNFAGVAASADVTSNQIVIRGNSPKGVLWRVDGIDIPNPNHFAYIGNSGGGITMFSSQVLTNSDFYTAAFPAQYGNALAGVFDLRFRNGNSKKHEYALQAGIQGLDISAEGPFSKKSEASYLFNYRYSILAFMQLIDPEMKNKVPEYQDFSFKINIPTLKAGTFSLVGIGGLSRSSGKPLENTTEWKTLDNRSGSRLDNNMGAVGLIHQIPLNRKSILRTWVSATYSEIHAEYELMKPTMEPDPINETRHKLYRYSGGMAINTKFSARHTNRTGFTYTSMFYNIDLKSKNIFTGTYGTVTKENGSTDLVQAFTESKYDLTSRLNINGGLHFQYFLLNGHYAAEPRIGMRWQFAKKHALSMGYGLHSQVEDPGIYLAKSAITPEYSVQPNHDLNFSRGHHFVLGYDYLIRNDLRFKAEAYYQMLYDIPVKQNSYYSLINSEGSYSNDSLVNDGKGKNYGIDLTFEKFLTKQYYFLVTVSLFESKYTGGDHIERNSRFNSNYVVNFLGGKEWTIRKKNILGINLKASFTGGEYYVPVDLEKSVAAHYEVLDEAHAYESRLPDFYYLDLTLTYRTNHKKYSGIWAIQIKNLLDQQPAVGYVYNDFNQSVESYHGIGILPFISYKVEF